MTTRRNVRDRAGLLSEPTNTSRWTIKEGGALWGPPVTPKKSGEPLRCASKLAAGPDEASGRLRYRREAEAAGL